MSHSRWSGVFALAAPVQMRDHSLAGAVAEVAERFSRIAEVEVPTPPSQEGVQILHDHRTGLVTHARSSFLSDRFTCLAQGLL